MKNILGYAFSTYNDAPMRVAGVLREMARSPDIEAHVLSNHLAPDDIEEFGLNWIHSPLTGQIIALKIHDLLEKLRPSLFVVDSFPLGAENELGPILKQLTCPAVFLQRNIPMRDPQRDMKASRVVETLYDLTIASRDVVPYKAWGRPLYTEPLTFAKQEDTIDEVDARLALRHTGKPLILFSQNVPGGMRLLNGLMRNCESMDGLRVEWRLMSTEENAPRVNGVDPLCDFSLVRWSKAIHAAILPADYASVFEVEMTGVPALFVPAKDQRDDQMRRAGPLAVLKADDLLKRIRGGKIPDHKVGLKFNGTQVAARALREIMGRRPAGMRITS